MNDDHNATTPRMTTAQLFIVPNNGPLFQESAIFPTNVGDLRMRAQPGGYDRSDLLRNLAKSKDE